jgi:hypothetical protein
MSIITFSGKHIAYAAQAGVAVLSPSDMQWPLACRSLGMEAKLVSPKVTQHRTPNDTPTTGTPIQTHNISLPQTQRNHLEVYH